MVQQRLFHSAVTLSELESHLWEAANILRGSRVDGTDWKSYILPLLLLKRICDGWEEEYQEAVDFSSRGTSPASWARTGTFQEARSLEGISMEGAVVQGGMQGELDALLPSVLDRPSPGETMSDRIDKTELVRRVAGR
jgi:hypothetical protein